MLLKGAKPKINSPELALVPKYVKIPPQSPQKNYKIGERGIAEKTRFLYFHLMGQMQISTLRVQWVSKTDGRIFKISKDLV